MAGDRPLPVQPFLRCAQEATARAGMLDLSAVQLLLPIYGLDPSSRPPYAPVPAMRTKEWFADCAPEARTPVEVNINSGRGLSIPAVAQQFTDHLGQLEQDVFVCRSYDVADQDAVLPPPFEDSFRNGPPLHGVVLRGELAEWSCDAVGWLAEVIADSGPARRPFAAAAHRRASSLGGLRDHRCGGGRVPRSATPTKGHRRAPVPGETRHPLGF